MGEAPSGVAPKRVVAVWVRKGVVRVRVFGCGSMMWAPREEVVASGSGLLRETLVLNDVGAGRL